MGTQEGKKERRKIVLNFSDSEDNDVSWGDFKVIDESNFDDSKNSGVRRKLGERSSYRPRPNPHKLIRHKQETDKCSDRHKQETNKNSDRRIKLSRPTSRHTHEVHKESRILEQKGNKSIYQEKNNVQITQDKKSKEKKYDDGKTRIVIVEDSRLPLNADVLQKRLNREVQIFTEPYLTLDNLSDFIKRNVKCSHKKTYLICSVGISDFIQLKGFKSCLDFKNHKPINNMYIANGDLMTLAEKRILNTKEIKNKMYRLLGKETETIFVSLFPVDFLMYQFHNIRIHKEKTEHQAPFEYKYRDITNWKTFLTDALHLYNKGLESPYIKIEKLVGTSPSFIDGFRFQEHQDIDMTDEFHRIVEELDHVRGSTQKISYNSSSNRSVNNDPSQKNQDRKNDRATFKTDEISRHRNLEKTSKKEFEEKTKRSVYERLSSKKDPVLVHEKPSLKKDPVLSSHHKVNNRGNIKSSRKEVEDVFPHIDLNNFSDVKQLSVAYQNECKAYYENPNSHPDFWKEYDDYMADMIKKKGEDSINYSEEKKKFDKFWPCVMERLIKDRWFSLRSEWMNIQERKSSYSSKKDENYKRKSPLPTQGSNSKWIRSSSQNKKRKLDVDTSGRVNIDVAGRSNLTPPEKLNVDVRNTSTKIVDVRNTSTKIKSTSSSIDPKYDKTSKRHDIKTLRRPNHTSRGKLEIDTSERVDSTHISRKQLVSDRKASTKMLRLTSSNVDPKLIDEVLEILLAMEHIGKLLGPLQLTVTKLHDRALSKRRLGADIVEYFESDKRHFVDIIRKLESIDIKFVSVLDKMVIEKSLTVLTNLCDILKPVVDIVSVAKQCVGKPVTDIMDFITDHLRHLGLNNPDEEIVDKVYDAIKEELYNMHKEMENWSTKNKKDDKIHLSSVFSNSSEESVHRSSNLSAFRECDGLVDDNVHDVDERWISGSDSKLIEKTAYYFPEPKLESNYTSYVGNPIFREPGLKNDYRLSTVNPKCMQKEPFKDPVAPNKYNTFRSNDYEATSSRDYEEFITSREDREIISYQDRAEEQFDMPLRSSYFNQENNMDNYSSYDRNTGYQTKENTMLISERNQSRLQVETHKTLYEEPEVTSHNFSCNSGQTRNTYNDYHKNVFQRMGPQVTDENAYQKTGSQMTQDINARLEPILNSVLNSISSNDKSNFNVEHSDSLGYSVQKNEQKHNANYSDVSVPISNNKDSLYDNSYKRENEYSDHQRNKYNDRDANDTRFNYGFEKYQYGK